MLSAILYPHLFVCTNSFIEFFFGVVGEKAAEVYEGGMKPTWPGTRRLFGELGLLVPTSATSAMTNVG